jgi:putative salt-induced outer membrane protein YdiY
VRATFLTLLLLLPPTYAAAQAAAPPPPPPKQEGTAEFAFVGTSGNATTSAFSLSGEHIVRPPKWTIKNRALFIRNSAEEVLTAESFLYAFRAERAINARLSGFGEYAYFRDEFAGVDHRNSVAGGLAIKLVNTAAHALSADVSLGYLNEQRLAGDDVSSPTYGFGALYKWTISPTATLDDEARFTGTFDIGEDWRFVNAVSVTAKLTQVLSLKVSNLVRYANFPPIGFKSTDTTTSVALVAKFSRQ